MTQSVMPLLFLPLNGMKRREIVISMVLCFIKAVRHHISHFSPYPFVCLIMSTKLIVLWFDRYYYHSPPLFVDHLVQSKDESVNEIDRLANMGFGERHVSFCVNCEQNNVDIDLWFFVAKYSPFYFDNLSSQMLRHKYFNNKNSQSPLFVSSSRMFIHSSHDLFHFLHYGATR